MVGEPLGDDDVGETEGELDGMSLGFTDGVRVLGVNDGCELGTDVG